jgi:hypothetical protein
MQSKTVSFFATKNPLCAVKNPRIFAFAFRFFAFLVVIPKGSAVVLVSFASPFWDRSDLQPKPWRPKGAFTPAVKA